MKEKYLITTRNEFIMFSLEDAFVVDKLDDLIKHHFGEVDNVYGKLRILIIENKINCPFIIEVLDFLIIIGIKITISFEDFFPFVTTMANCGFKAEQIASHYAIESKKHL